MNKILKQSSNFHLFKNAAPNAFFICQQSVMRVYWLFTELGLKDVLKDGVCFVIDVPPRSGSGLLKAPSHPRAHLSRILPLHSPVLPQTHMSAR